MPIRHRLSLAAALVIAAPSFGQLSLQQVGNGFNQPLYLTAMPGDANHVYVVEKEGLIRTLNTATGSINATPFLDLPSMLGSNQLVTIEDAGLLGMTFAPDYSNGNGYMYINYVGANAGSPIGGETRIDRITVTNGVVETNSRVNIATFQQPNQVWHKGGWIDFGKDGHLYIGMGDGGGDNDPFNLSQNMESAMGKLLRIAPSTTAGVGGYTVPANNPFATATNDITKIVFASGLRNPWRNSFDSLTGDLYLGDVGQAMWEEIDFIAAGSAGGQNFGWRALEGSHDNPDVPDPPPAGAVNPIYEYSHASTPNGWASVIGGYVARGGDLFDNGQSLDGTYFFGDYMTGYIFSFRYTGGVLTDFRDWTAELNSAAIFGDFNLVSFGLDSLGRLYAIDYGGQIHRFAFSPVPEPSTLAMIGLVGAGWLAWRRRRSAATTS